MLTTIEKVIFLQGIDIFEFTSTEDLSQIAAIAEELECGAGKVIFNEGNLSDAMYMVLEGKVRLVRDGTDVVECRHADVFGTWALFDDEPRVVTAVADDDSRLLIIQKEDFIDLLGDNLRITQGVLKKLVKRLRGLVERAGTVKPGEHNSP